MDSKPLILGCSRSPILGWAERTLLDSMVDSRSPMLGWAEPIFVRDHFVDVQKQSKVAR